MALVAELTFADHAPMRFLKGIATVDLLHAYISDALFITCGSGSMQATCEVQTLHSPSCLSLRLEATRISLELYFKASFLAKLSRKERARELQSEDVAWSDRLSSR